LQLFELPGSWYHLSRTSWCWPQELLLWISPCLPCKACIILLQPRVWTRNVLTRHREILSTTIEYSAPKVDLVPHILTTGLGIGGSHNKYVFKCLLDFGETHLLINKKCIPVSVRLNVCSIIKFATNQGKICLSWQGQTPTPLSIQVFIDSMLWHE
jgi:hypothetical protein